MSAIILLSIAAVVAVGTAVVFMRYLGNGNGLGVGSVGEPRSEASAPVPGDDPAVPHGQPGVVRGTPSHGIPETTEGPISVDSVPSVAENPAAVFSATSLRLRREIYALSRRGNLNLTIGVVTTGFALGLLAYMIFDESTAPGTFSEALSLYLPRITTVTFIEVFAFFFLKLYRASLIEIKFYQNELTCLASLQIALAASHTCPDPDALRTVLDRLARRNPNAHAVDPFSPTPNLPEDDRLKAFGELLGKAAGVAAVNAK
jgi:hypothetical protein